MTRNSNPSAIRRILFCLAVTLLAAGLTCVGPAARADDPPVFNWTAAPVGQQVPIVRATFDQGGYQLTDGDGEVITVPFINNNLYSMQFCISPTGAMYFVNTGSVPILYAPPDAYIENATVPGARWFPFSPTFQPATPVYLGLAPTWDAYVAMGWYSGMHYYGGYWSADAYYDGIVYAPAPGLYFVVDGHRYNDWDGYHSYYVRRGGYYHEGYRHYGIYDHAERRIRPGEHGFDGPHSRLGGPGGARPGEGGFGHGVHPGDAHGGPGHEEARGGGAHPGAEGEHKVGGGVASSADEHKFGGGSTGLSHPGGGLGGSSTHTFGSGSKTGLSGSSGGLGGSSHTFGSGAKTGIGSSSMGLNHSSGGFGGGSSSGLGHSGGSGFGSSSSGLGHSGGSGFGGSSSHSSGFGGGGGSSSHSSGFGGGGGSSSHSSGFGGGGGSSSHSGGGFNLGNAGGGSHSSSSGSSGGHSSSSAPSKPKK